MTVSCAENPNLRAAARVFGLLLLREVDDQLLEEFGSPELLQWFAQQGLPMPAPGDKKAQDALAAEYFEALINPKDATPPVHSLAIGGGYEGDPAAGIRRVAKELGAELSPEASRGAPVDHLGSELMLWSEIAARSPHSAPAFAKEFLSWAPAWCHARAGKTTGFYHSLFRMTADFAGVIVEEELGD